MPDGLISAIYLAVAVVFAVGLKALSKVRTARPGNLFSLGGMLVGILLTLGLYGGWRIPRVLIALAIGTAIGIVWAEKVPMTAMPQMVALFNGFGGAASSLVALCEYVKSGREVTPGALAAILASTLIGNVTFSGSVLAFAKLQWEKRLGRPILFRGQHLLNALLLAASAVAAIWIFRSGDLSARAHPASFGLIHLLTLALGVLIVIPIGGADMPVVICLLNSYSGMAVAATGFVLRNDFLIIAGNLVGASGIILAAIMCKAMNRSLANVLFGGFGAVSPSAAGAEVKGTVKEASPEEAAEILANAQSVIICPGYGMAAAQAQHAVRELAELLEKNGATVKYAIHPVAGRMPGHMNVLLAEAQVPYDKLYEMDAINDEFSHTDVALVVGANDVVNPAAKNTPGSPIYGMPVLNADQARSVLVLKRSMKPGFAGIDNELFVRPNTMMVFGDARQTLQRISAAVKDSAA